MLTQIGDKITTRRAAEIIRCSEAHVRRLLSSGVLEGELFSGVWAVSKKSAESFARIPQKTGRPRGG